ncbi:MAG: glycosyltransferase [Bacteroidales bacterium]|nr:glycosyltransferase [Bacteroidales bacterium]
MNKIVRWLIPQTYKNDYQFYRQWITSSWIKNNGKVKKGIEIPLKLRYILGKIKFIDYIIPNKLRKDKALIVCCGAHPNYTAWPYMYNHEIIPIIWDCWPKYHRELLNSIKRNKIQTIFCTSSQTRDLIKKDLPYVNSFWIPEGIDIKAYKMGSNLKDRKIDILELGRKLEWVHNGIKEFNKDSKYNHLYSQSNKLLFKDFEELTDGLANAKITICYPRCDTHPEIAGNIETLTQRYWECMLSGTLIVGRAPKELIDFCGYNPVVELSSNKFEIELENILNNIENYQSLCNTNRDFAINNASWDLRIKYIKDVLIKLGYSV